MSRDDPNFGGNPGRLNSGGWNSTTAGGYNGPGDRSGSWTGGYADPRGMATPGAGQAGRDWNANVARAGGFTPGMNFDNTTGGYVPGQIRSNPIPPAKPNPANVKNPKITPTSWGPYTAPYFDGVRPPNIMASYAWGLENRPLTEMLGNPMFGGLGGIWSPTSAGPNGYVSSPTGSYDPVQSGNNGPRSPQMNGTTGWGNDPGPYGPRSIWSGNW